MSLTGVNWRFFQEDKVYNFKIHLLLKTKQRNVSIFFEHNWGKV